jgi:hypothetical protein
VIKISGIHSAFRCLHVNKTSAHGTSECPKPFLAFYPMSDLGFTQGAEFKQIKVKSDILPGTGICYDMADLDVGYHGLAGKTGTGKQGKR